MHKETSILVFATRLLPIGGIESHMLEFCVQIAKSGVIIDLVVLDCNILPETEFFYRQVCREVYLGKSGNTIQRFAWLLSVATKFNKNRYNAIYTNGQGGSVLALSRILLRRHVWVHHHHTSGDIHDQSTWTKSYIKALKKANAVIACSSRNAKDMKIALNREILSIPCFSREIPEVARSSYKKKQFGYYGRLIPEKGIDLLCKLSEDKDILDIDFHIWGNGEAYPPDYFKSYPNIHYHGAFIGVEELSKILSILDAYLLLSVHPEGLPIALLEAMSVGLPWIATDCGGIPDIAIDPISTRVIPLTLNYEEVKQDVIDLASDLSKGKIDRTNQKKMYLLKFSNVVLVKRWREVFGI